MSDYWESIERVTSLMDVRTVIDGGAYDGWITSRMIPLFPNAKFYCFEPSPQTFATLSKRYEGNPNVTCIEAALSDREETVPFNIGAMQYVSSLYPRNTTGRRYYKSDFGMVETVPVRTITLDAFCAAEGIETIDYMKLDTQGAEFKILTGASGLLSRQAISVIFTEFFLVPHYEGAPLLFDIWRLLRDKNYDIFDLFPNAHATNGQLRDGDAIFASNTFRQRYLDTQPDEI